MRLTRFRALTGKFEGIPNFRIIVDKWSGPLSKRRRAMGDKGKKDKEKVLKQKSTKMEQKSKGKLDRQQRKIP
jgi:hypothetical protein